MRYGAVRCLEFAALAGVCVAGTVASVTSTMAGDCPCRPGEPAAGFHHQAPPPMAALPPLGADFASRSAGPMPTLPVRPIPPPPGTLTLTYLRPSRPVPEEKHPRLGMLEVVAPAGAIVAVQGMKGYFGEDCLWHFESKEPLIPGVPHIYHVVSSMPGVGRQTADVRVVRLIPGRIVSLEFCPN
jgi:hypothetical protein